MSDFLDSGEWTSFASTNVAEAMYDADRERLSIRFIRGKTYTYPGVSRSMAEDFLRAPSKGIWVNRTLVKPGWSFLPG